MLIERKRRWAREGLGGLLPDAHETPASTLHVTPVTRHQQPHFQHPELSRILSNIKVANFVEKVS
jgi:hypothetical protein